MLGLQYNQEMPVKLNRKPTNAKDPLMEVADLVTEMKEVKHHYNKGVKATRIAPKFPKNDGKQTPMKGHPVFIAQHATATCCRKCIQKWHEIEKGRALNEEEMEFILKLIMGWIEEQLNHKVK